MHMAMRILFHRQVHLECDQCPKQCVLHHRQLPNTSARYILPIPSLTFFHVFTAEISSNMGECHRSDAVLIEFIKAIQERYM